MAEAVIGGAHFQSKPQQRPVTKLWYRRLFQSFHPYPDL